MKITLITLTILFSSAAFAELQQWGETSHSSRLIHTEDIKWLNVFEPHHNIVIRRTFQYPPRVPDERFMPRIGAVTVIHHGCGVKGWAQLAWGGPWERHVGLEFESAPGECIEATIEIWSA